MCYQLKTAYRDGTTHVFFEPLDFIAKLAALVPSPRVHLTRYHGVFAPNSKMRAEITPAKRGKQNPHALTTTLTAAEKHRAMGWAQLEAGVQDQCGALPSMWQQDEDRCVDQA